MTVVLGPEFDERLRGALLDVLAQLGGRAVGHDWGVAGSQELEGFEVDLEGHRLLIEAETYAGLSIEGPSELVERIRRMVEERTGHP
jgi:hypothetical protein